MAFNITSTLEKVILNNPNCIWMIICVQMNSRDKDFRYMATADLVVELDKDTFKLDADSEKRLTAMVLKLLEDNSNQVQELAVKW
jgi:cullin-associated NEDD8-dissociated protein 1